MAGWEFRGISGQQVGTEFTAEGEDGAEVYLNDLYSTHHATLTTQFNVWKSGKYVDSPRPNPRPEIARWDASAGYQRS